MELLPAIILRVLHFLYALISLVYSFWRRQTRLTPQPLESARRRLPKNLAVVFVGDPNIPQGVVEGTILQSCRNLVEWCQTLGIPKLTIYEEHGLLLRLEPKIREVIFGQDSEAPASDSENEYQPLTPPASVYSGSRQLSPCHSMSDITKVTVFKSPTLDSEYGNGGSSLEARSALNHISLCLASAESSKPAIANLARSLYFDHKHLPEMTGKRVKGPVGFSLTVNGVNSLLESESGLSSPDFMIIHPINPMQYNRTPLELHGFPPWHIRLTEIYLNVDEDRRLSWRRWLRNRITYAPAPTILDEVGFRNALDEFAMAEFRFGK